MNTAPVCNHDLPLPPRTTLADALHGYREYRKPLSYEPSFFAARTGLGAPWVEPFERRDAELKKLIKAQAIDAANDAAVSLQQVGDFRRDLEDVLPIMENRRAIAHSVARRLKSCMPHATESNARDLTELPEKMYLCRVDGHAGIDAESGDRRFAFPFKCGSSRFCPDCAREHSMYEASKYGQACLEHVNRGGQYRAHYLVFTRPSVPLGQMQAGVAETLAMFRDWLDRKRNCSGVQRRRHGWSPRKKKIPMWQPGQRVEGQDYSGRDSGNVIRGPGGDGVHGALVQVECHLTAKGLWHPHLNVILLTKGKFSYAMARRAWGFNVECQPITPQAQGFARSFAELIKYPFRHVAEKSQAKADAGETQAPPFEAWPDAAVVEWHAATRAEVQCSDGDTRIQGARWLRSYGALHGIPPPESTLQDMRTLARITFTDDGVYSVSAFVGSIPGSKFPDSTLKGHVRGYRVPQVRPPPTIPDRQSG